MSAGFCARCAMATAAEMLHTVAYARMSKPGHGSANDAEKKAY
jgi:hypothetical protein